MDEDIRAYARSLIAGAPMHRFVYIAAVRAYAVEKYGNAQDVVMFAERTARHVWATRPKDSSIELHRVG